MPPSTADTQSSADRLTSLDALRGLAVLGILVMNVQGFAMVSAAYVNPLAQGGLDLAEWSVWALGRIFFDYKFIGLFSLLFGAGLALFITRAEQAGRDGLSLHARRMVWLGLFGMLHAYLIWYGDILLTYAVCGLLVVWAIRLSPAWLAGLGVLVALPGAALLVLAQIDIDALSAAQRASMAAAFWTPDEAVIAAEQAAIVGSWSEQMEARRSSVGFMLNWLLPRENLWKSCGFMLLGMALYKSGFFQRRWSQAGYARLAIVTLGSGFALTFTGLFLDVRAGFDIGWSLNGGRAWLYVSSFPQAVGYAALFYWMWGRGWLDLVGVWLADVGRMAFTNYIAQSIICAWIFYGWGLGLFGALDRTAQLGVVAGIWVAQLLYSRFWLRRFRFGPLEWSWRALTYWTSPALRR